MRRTLDLIVAKFDAESRLRAEGLGAEPPPEPTRTLELTGPGILTDALDGLLERTSAAALGIRSSHKLQVTSRQAPPRWASASPAHRLAVD